MNIEGAWDKPGPGNNVAMLLEYTAVPKNDAIDVGKGHERREDKLTRATRIDVLFSPPDSEEECHSESSFPGTVNVDQTRHQDGGWPAVKSCMVRQIILHFYPRYLSCHMHSSHV